MDFLYPQYISNDHPAMDFLHNLETKSYYVDKDSLGVTLGGCIMKAILRWANMLKCHMKVCSSMYCGFLHFSDTTSKAVPNVDLMERVCYLANKISGL